MQQSELNCTNMRLINLLLLLLPLTGFSQVNMLRNVVADTTKQDSLHVFGNARTLEYYNTPRWYSGHYNETKKGKIETPINVMDTGLKIETVETRDTIYKCPQTYGFTLFVYDSNSGSLKAKDPDCTVEKIVTTRRYKLYIINEYGQKEYLSMELTKQK